jgi:lipoprotein
MKKVIMLAILVMTVISCSELAKMEDEYQQDLRERGYRCRYNYKGEVQVCGYIN